MIISVDQAKKEIADFKGWSDSKIERKLNAIEQAIRSHTHNNFQNRGIRADCAVIAQKVYGDVPGLNVGDTIQITESRFNSGLFVVEAIEGNMITVDKTLIDESHVLVTKVEYPADVIDCVFNCLEWELEYREKAGIQSESKTLSRHSHSVTYVQQAGDNTVKGYPTSLFSCLSSYMKARF